MVFGNQTIPTELILIGLPQTLKVCILFFVVLFIVYTLTVLGNSFLICAVIISPRMHTPMYYFLCHLSFIDLCYSSNSLPKTLLDLFSKRRRISTIGCLVQMNIGLFLGGTECILLAVMAYDRYIAIRHPLHYTVYMSWKICKTTTAVMWSGSFIGSIIPTFKSLVFCTKNTLDHFSCEVLALLDLACGNVTFYKTMLHVASTYVLLLPFLFIVVSYICIIVSILQIRSSDGRSKAFSTCASHLTVVFMFYGTSMAMYMGQSSRFSSKQKYISLIYGVLTPLLNPLIYSLRNNDVKEAFTKIITYCSALKKA